MAAIAGMILKVRILAKVVMIKKYQELIKYLIIKK